MRRRLVLSLIFTALAAAFFVQSAPEARPQAADPTDELIETADGVKLRGILYKAQNSKNGSCVIIIHEPFKDPTKKDWDGLGRTLAKNGYHTLRFDLRGHGKSKELIPAKFWREQLNTKLPGATKNPPRDTLDEKDFHNKKYYYPQLIYDLAGARNHLDKLNDDGQVNTSSIYLIAEGDAVTLAMLFLATEWHREQKKPMGFLNAQKFWVAANQQIAAGGSPAGRDYGGAVWLSPRQMSGFSTNAIKNWVSDYGRGIDGDMRKETPMLFFVGEKDEQGKKDVTFFNEKVMIAKGMKERKIEPLDTTFTDKGQIKGTALRGVDLLGKNDTLKTEDTILEFLKAMEDQRRKKARITRDYQEPVKINLASFGS